MHNILDLNILSIEASILSFNFVPILIYSFILLLLGELDQNDFLTYLQEIFDFIHLRGCQAVEILPNT